MSANSPAARKLKREYGRLAADPVHPGIFVRPLETNFLHAHFILSGEVFHDTPYEGGVYHGLLIFPKNYPFAPPAILTRTPSGRFKPNDQICFSMSNYHPESWEPSASSYFFACLLFFCFSQLVVCSSSSSNDFFSFRSGRFEPY